MRLLHLLLMLLQMRRMGVMHLLLMRVELLSLVRLLLLVLLLVRLLVRLLLLDHGEIRIPPRLLLRLQRIPVECLLMMMMMLLLLGLLGIMRGHTLILTSSPHHNIIIHHGMGMSLRSNGGNRLGWLLRSLLHPWIWMVIHRSLRRSTLIMNRNVIHLLRLCLLLRGRLLMIIHRIIIPPLLLLRKIHSHVARHLIIIRTPPLRMMMLLLKYELLLHLLKLLLQLRIILGVRMLLLLLKLGVGLLLGMMTAPASSPGLEPTGVLMIHLKVVIKGAGIIIIIF
jgi:hypothetical protein